MYQDRIVITGVGLTCPLGNDLPTFRKALLEGRSGVSSFPVRNMGDQPAGVCDFDKTKYQKRKEVRVGTRAGGIGIFCAQEALANAGLDLKDLNPSRIGTYLGITEHGNVETETEVLANLLQALPCELPVRIPTLRSRNFHQPRIHRTKFHTLAGPGLLLHQ